MGGCMSSPAEPKSNHGNVPHSYEPPPQQAPTYPSVHLADPAPIAESTPTYHHTSQLSLNSNSTVSTMYNTRDVIYVGIDFGTSRSGYALAMDQDRVQIQNSYPGEMDATPKTLTALLYEIVSPTDWQPVTWGMEAYKRYHTFSPRDRDKYAFINHFKLALLDDSPECAVPLPKSCPLAPMTIVTHYLHFMIQHIEQTLIECYGNKYRKSHVLWCMTVPARCSDAGKDRLRQACCQAGMVSNPRSDKLMLVHEPEAAALTAREQGRLYTRFGETFLVIDAGGGTVDLTVHTVIDKLGRGVLSEATHREGLLAGSSFIDEQFKKYTCNYLGVQRFQEWQSRFPQDYIKFMNEEWERVKRNFKGNDNPNERHPQTESIPIPNSLYKMLSDEVLAKLEKDQDGFDDRLCLTPVQIERFFHVVVDNIVQIAGAMIQRARKYPDQVLLVGGLGSSPYLFKRVSQALPNVQVTTPKFGFAAIVEGSVLYAKEPSLLYQRCSLMTYGIETSAPWTPGAPDKTLVQAFNKYMTSHYFLKFVTTDQLVTVSDVVRYRFVPISNRQTHCHFDIYASADPNVQFIEEGGATQLIATVTVPVTMNPNGKPEDSVISLMFKFGTTEIEVLAEEEKTQRRVAATITFNSIPVPPGGGNTLDHTTPYLNQGTGQTGVSSSSEVTAFNVGAMGIPAGGTAVPRWK